MIIRKNDHGNSYDNDNSNNNEEQIMMTIKK